MSEADTERPSLGFLLVRLGEAIDRRFVAELARLELRPRELRALVLIDRHPRCSQRELAGRMEADPGNLVDVLDALEARGLITRRLGTKDRRRRTLELTRAGARLLARANKATQAVEREVIAPIGEGERAVLEAIALRVWEASRASP
jgi:DNA-binding MarR family transcriptional regulator